MKKLRVLENFAGYGSQSIALDNLHINNEVVGISEIDPDAIIAYAALRGCDLNKIVDISMDDMKRILMNKNVGYDFQKNKSKIPRMRKDKLIQLFNADQFSKNLGDISIIKPQDVPKHDLFTYSFPCQDISVAGNMQGIEKGKTRSGLLYECEKIIEHCRPKYLLMENVKNLVGKKFKTQFDEWLQYLESLGYKNYWKVLNAKDFGIAQNRERVFVVSILGDEGCEFPNGFKLEKRLKDFLEDSVEDKYYLSEEIQKRFKQVKVDDGTNNIIGTTAPKERSIGQRDLVYSQEGTMGALVATDYKQPKQIVEIPQATKKGYAELEIPGIADLSFPNSKTRRGRVQEGGTDSPTIMANNQELCVFEEVKNGAIRGRYNEDGKIEQQLELKSDGVINTITGVQKDNIVVVPRINQVGMLDIKGNEQIRRVYGDNGLSPTLNTMQGGNRQPKVIVDSKIKPSVKINFEREKYKISVSDKEIYQCKCDSGWQDNKVGIKVCPTLRAGNSHTCVYNDFRIRKLTPRECFRLMGLSDEQIDKIQQTGLSDSAQYKLAGNSIVVQVLEGIFRNLFINNSNSLDNR